MQRRDVLRSAGLAVTATAAGLAGCHTEGGGEVKPTPNPGGDHPECAPPVGGLADALPDSEAFERHGDVTVSDASHDDGVTRTAYALYRGPGGGECYCSATEFDSAAAASEGAEHVRLEGGNSNRALGLVQFGRYVYFGAGGDRQEVRRLLGATSLSEACLDSAFRSPTGTATPEPL